MKSQWSHGHCFVSLIYGWLKYLVLTNHLGGLSVIVCDDFYQLPPVNPPAIYSQFNLNKATLKYINGLELWYLFKMAELTEVMRQRGDTRLIEMLNKIRLGDVDMLL